MKDPESGPGQIPETGRMVRTCGQKAVIATFRHDTSRNLDPALHTHSVVANMVQGGDGKWRTMANERQYASKMPLGDHCRDELAGELARLGYGIEKTHAEGRFEIAGVSRDVIKAFSTRRAEIEVAMDACGLSSTADNPYLARRAARMICSLKRDVDEEALRETWVKQAAVLGFDARVLTASALERDHGNSELGRNAATVSVANGRAGADLGSLFANAEVQIDPARAAVDWALAYLSERDAVLSGTETKCADRVNGRSSYRRQASTAANGDVAQKDGERTT